MLKTLGALVGRLPWLYGLAHQLSLSGKPAVASAGGRAAGSDEGQAAESQAPEFLSADSDPAHLRSTIVTRMREGRHLVVTGLPLREIARLCLDHDYRWRLHGGHAVNGHTRFDLIPGRPAAPLGHRPPVRRPTSE